MPGRPLAARLLGTSAPAAWVACFAAFVGSAAFAEERVDFARDVRPILSRNCVFCHGPDEEHRQGNLRMDDEEDAKLDRGGYQAILPGSVEESEAIRRILSDDESEKMPPPDSHKKLTAKEIETLTKWVEQGAEWSGHWAYVAPERAADPPVKDAVWSRNFVDRFVLARLEEQGLPPSPPTDPVTLVRRLSFDLTGLPPESADVEAFAADPSDASYLALVDKYLGSPAYGERMAVYWLDLVRYADTVGYHGDQDHRISPYRDYVIAAFNANLPFDQFTREQLAGDLLPDPTIAQRVATGYNRMLQTTHEGGLQQKEYLAIYAADRVRNVSNVWMGATVGCAQCHDHKYDPYTIKDHYALSAFFADVDEAKHFTLGSNDLPTKRPPEIPVPTEEEAEREAELIAAVAEAKKQLEAAGAEETGAEGAGDNAAKKAAEEKLAQAEKQLKAHRDSIRQCMVTVSIEPRTMRVLPRGNWMDDSGEVVEPSVPEFLGKIAKEERATRLDLANWLVDGKSDSGLLTARVFANRFWYLAFGEGLSRSLDDFGGQGEPPSHPELLDRLAHEFAGSGWNVKATMRTLVTSSAYRQSSTVSPEALAADPENRLFGRQNRFRLPAEMVRDNALSISGLLVDEMGGDSVKPYQPDGYYRHLNFPKRTYKSHDDERQWRRGVYVHWQRQYLHPMLKAFDAPSREECTAKRPQSNTPLASLVLLNDPTFVEAARRFAETLLLEAEKRETPVSTTNAPAASGQVVDAQAPFDAILESAFRRTLSRSLEASERPKFAEFYASQKARFAANPKDAEALIGVGLSKRIGDADPVELAAWTSVCRALFNLSETITRN
ncbi:MAG TPA: PSD1 and planctomycete cytochrome C domain-containing protein [Pirellulaceae bacterium]|jgi:hypothetical protein|nr:PSD1 and planctomycete cytochrome C domain-containing protein [Pirellulaceae bacterium]